MINVWVFGNLFDGITDWKTIHQFSTLAEAFENRGCNFKFINYYKDLILHKNSNFVGYDNELLDAPDIVLLKVFVHSKYDKMKLDRLKELGTFIVNDSDSMIRNLNKANMYEQLEKDGISIPKTVNIPCDQYNQFYEKLVDEKIGWPCLVKPNYGWSGAGLTICKNKYELETAVKTLQASVVKDLWTYAPKVTHAIVQEIVAAEYFINWVGIGTKILYPYMGYGSCTHLGKTTYKDHPLYDKFMKYRFQLAYDAPPNGIDIMAKSMDSLGYDFVRAEMFATKDGYKICELNPSCMMSQSVVMYRENFSNKVVDHTLTLYEQFKKGEYKIPSITTI